MEHIAAIMLLVGCSHADMTCNELPAPQVAFETMEECNGTLANAIGQVASVGTVVRAKCAAVDPAWFEEDIEISWDVTEDGRLDVAINNVGPTEVATHYAMADKVEAASNTPAKQ